jgi:predicted RNase H-like nuclease (RuvC/YqgF family)
MKFLTTILLLIAPIFTYGQGVRDNDFEKKIMALEVRNQKLLNELNSVKQSNIKLEKTVSGMSNKLRAEIIKSQELQAQNERAVNLSLDEFSKKFEKQNETVNGVQKALDERFNSQFIYFILALIAIVITAILLTRSSTKKALEQNAANWNDFQTHMLKK